MRLGPFRQPAVQTPVEDAAMAFNQELMRVRRAHKAGAERAFRYQLIAAAVAVLATPAAARPQAPASVQPPPGLSRLETLGAENARLVARVDSLRNELGQHRFAEKFLDSALEEQANRFAMIVTFAVAAVSAFTFAGVLWEVRRTKGDLKTKMNVTLDLQRRERAAVEARLAESDVFMRRAAGNAYVAIATIYEESSPGLAVAAWLLAAGNFYTAQSGASDRDHSLGPTSLDNALETLRGISPADRQKVGGELDRAAHLCNEAFDLLHRWGGRETANKVAAIRVGIQQLTPEPSGASQEAASGLLQAPGRNPVS